MRQQYMPVLLGNATLFSSVDEIVPFVIKKFNFYAIYRYPLKGQCQDMVGEMSPWSSSLGLN
jgi:hypothetical protein